MRIEQKLLFRLQDLDEDWWSFCVTMKWWISLLFITVRQFEEFQKMKV